MKRTIIAAGSAIALGIAATADTSAPAEKGLLEKVQDGEPMRMVYELQAQAWVLFLPVTAKASFDTRLNGRDYSITSTVKTTGLADIFVNYNLSLQASGYVRDDHLKTYSYVSQNNDGKKNRRVEMTYDVPNNDFTMVATPAFGDLGDPPATAEQALDANDPLTALISFGLEPRTDASNPCGGPIKSFGGKELSHLKLEYVGMKKVKSKAWKGNAVECHVSLERVAGFKNGASSNNISGVDGPIRMWLAPLENGTHVPVRIEADTDRIGKIVLQASKLRFEPIVTEEASNQARGG